MSSYDDWVRMCDRNPPLIRYEPSGGTFERCCPRCGRFVKADGEILFNEELGPKREPNATCKRCGRIQMYFVGYF